MKHKIAWTDFTWNPVWGCNAKCSYCYAAKFSKRFAGVMAEREVKSYNLKLKSSEIKYKTEIQNALEYFRPTFLYHRYNTKFPVNPKRIFVNSMSDIAFWKEKWITDVMKRIKEYPQHTFQILTKFPEKLMDIKFPDNVWLGVTVETQKTFDKRVYDLAELKVKHRFVSFEPLFEEIHTEHYLLTKGNDNEYPFKIAEKYKTKYINVIDWVIVGGQTGANSKKMEPGWVNVIYDACVRNKIPFFLKNWGSNSMFKDIEIDKIFQKFPKNNNH